MTSLRRSFAVMLAAVGGLMTEVAGEVADGLILHAFTTERYVTEVTLPPRDRKPEGYAELDLTSYEIPTPF